MLFQLLSPIARLALWVFFRRIDIMARERVATDRPLVFVANHPNVMLDVLILSLYAPTHALRFIGESTLFKHPLYAWFMRQLGVILVERGQDEGARMVRNREMLRLASHTLKGGRALALFPEGLSHAEPRVRALKSGASRIALRTEADADGQLGIQIVPVGLLYTDPDIFRSDVFVHFGEAIEVRSFLPAYQENQPAAEQALTELIHERLTFLTRHIGQPDLETVIHDLFAVYADRVATDLPESTELAVRLRAEQEIIRAVQHFARTEPEVVQSFATRLRAHHRKLRRLRLEPASIAPAASLPSVGYLLLAVLLSPLALYGFIHNALPYYLPRLFVRPYRDRPEMIGTVKVAIGTALFPLSYLIMMGLASLIVNLPGTLLYGLSLPLSGLFVLFYNEHILHHWPLWQSLVLRHYRSYLNRLAEERALLIRDLDAVKARYLENL